MPIYAPPERRASWFLSSKDGHRSVNPEVMHLLRIAFMIFSGIDYTDLFQPLQLITLTVVQQSSFEAMAWNTPRIKQLALPTDDQSIAD